MEEIEVDGWNTFQEIFLMVIIALLVGLGFFILMIILELLGIKYSNSLTYS